jgi:hypothetical protein
MRAQLKTRRNLENVGFDNETVPDKSFIISFLLTLEVISWVEENCSETTETSLISGFSYKLVNQLNEIQFAVVSTVILLAMEVHPSMEAFS